MRWIVAPLVIATLAAVLLVPAASSPSSPDLGRCTKFGTSGNDPLAGTPRRDVICGLQGNDYISGSGGNDRLFGDTGTDTIVGGKGADIIKGGKGRGRLFAVDGEANDLVNGGAGNDLCFGDRGDILRNCEREFRGATIAESNALARVVNGGIGLVESLSISPAPTVVVTVTETQTVPPNCGGHPAPPPIC